MGTVVRQRPRPPLLLVAGLAVLGAVYLGAGEPGEGQWHVVLLHATEVRANRVIVLIDDSGSTAGTEPAVQFQLNRLAAAGIRIDRRTTIPGFAVSFSDRYNLLDTFDRTVAEHPLHPRPRLRSGHRGPSCRM